MRTAFSDRLIEEARSDSRLILMTGDHGYALFDSFRNACPDQYLNVGIAEQNMVGTAAGLAKSGFHPVVYGLSAFVPVRVLEQIKLDVCYENLPVVFIGDGAGVVYTTFGTSHQSTEDIAALRALPNIRIVSPSDDYEMNECLGYAFKEKAPVYVRMGKADLGNVHSKPPGLAPSQLHLVVPGTTGGLAWVATGSQVHNALKVAKRWPGSSVWSAPFIKPLNETQVASVCQTHGAVIVLEEHNVIGGLGSAITEIASTHHPVRILRIGIQDRFSSGTGTYQDLMEEHGLTPEKIHAKVERFLFENTDHRSVRVHRASAS